MIVLCAFWNERPGGTARWSETFLWDREPALARAVTLLAMFERSGRGLPRALGVARRLE